MIIHFTNEVSGIFDKISRMLSQRFLVINFSFIFNDYKLFSPFLIMTERLLGCVILKTFVNADLLETISKIKIILTWFERNQTSFPYLIYFSYPKYKHLCLTPMYQSESRVLLSPTHKLTDQSRNPYNLYFFS